MTIDQAIKVLRDILDDEESLWGADGNNALKLGIEALKREQEWRVNPRWGLPPLLPGATEE